MRLIANKHDDFSRLGAFVVACRVEAAANLLGRESVKGAQGACE